MPIDDATPDDPPHEAWHGPRHLLRAGLRTAALGLIAVVFIDPRILATCAWAVVPVSLLEFWAVARGRSSMRLAVGTFLGVSLVLGAAYFQAFYASAAITTGSVAVGMAAIEGEIGYLTTGSFVSPLVELVYAIQCQALACAIVILWRMPRRSRRDIVWSWVGLATLVPLVDWTLLVLVQRRSLDAALIGLSIILLMVGSAAGTGFLLVLYAAVDALATRIALHSRP